MANKKTAYDIRAEQLSLPFNHSPSFDIPAGSFRRTEAIQEAFRAALKRCTLSRIQIADEMSRLLNEKITENHINNWAAEKKNGWRLPLEYAAAFSVITNDTQVVKAAFLRSGINILDDSQMVFFEIGKAIEEKRRNDAILKENRNHLKKLEMQGKL